MALLDALREDELTSKDLWGGLKILGHLGGGGARGGSGLPPLKPGRTGEAERGQHDQNESNHYEDDGPRFWLSFRGAWDRQWIKVDVLSCSLLRQVLKSDLFGRRELLVAVAQVGHSELSSYLCHTSLSTCQGNSTSMSDQPIWCLAEHATRNARLGILGSFDDARKP